MPVAVLCFMARYASWEAPQEWRALASLRLGSPRFTSPSDPKPQHPHLSKGPYSR